VRSEGRIRFVRVHDIDCIAGARNYAELRIGRKVHLLRETLESLEARLPYKKFVRVSKSAIVNVERIMELRPKSHGDLIVVLKDGTRLTVTRTYRARVQLELGA
jgi:two-component system LytT family response regulator